MKILVCLHASLLSVLSLTVAGSLAAQSAVPKPASRIAANADMTPRTRLTGHMPRWVTPAADAGAVPDSTPVRITLVLSRSAEQEAAFTQLLVDQQNPSSPRYRQWLTPAQVGEQFGPSMDDVNAVTQWLTRQNLNVVSVAPSRVFVEVTGTTGTVGTALNTSFHNYLLDGQARLAASSEPAIPTALAVAVSGIDGMAEIPLRPFHTVAAAEPRATGNGVRPMYSNSSNTTHYIFPGDFAKIYDIPTTSGGVYAGTGVKVAIIGRSQVAAVDITQLESLAGLPLSVPNNVIAAGSADPGQTKTDDQSEATLDVQRVLTTAPGVQADLVLGKSTSTSDGLTLAMQHNVQTLLDPVMSISFGACETSAGLSNVNYFDALFKQAAAEGISTFVSSGDSGAAGCSASFTAPTGKEVLGINFLCSSSYVTCVGGTEFSDASAYALYWSTTNSTTYTSALGYIPEGAWNEPSYQATTGGVTSTAYQLASTGGGASIYLAKPTWQTGTGVPADGKRDTPDISFTSAAHDGYYGCESFKGSAYDCSTGGGAVFSGTSAAAPGMAAVAAILVQRAGKSQGNLNPVLYSLAATTSSAFHDATPVSSGVASCSVSVASMCNNSTPGTSGLTGLSGYPLQVGYDEATGLGSLDVANFLNAAVPALLSSTTSVTAQPATIVVGNTAVFTATVTGSGSGTISGTVQFYSNGTALGSPVTIASGKAATPATAFNASGTYSITATYSGNTTYAASTSAALSFVVSAAAPVGLGVSASPSSLTLAAGAATGNTTNVSVITTGSYYGSVALTCAVMYSGGTATYAPTCSFAPASLTFTGGLSGWSVLTIATTVPHAISSPGQAARNKALFAPVGGISFAALLLVLIPARRRRKMGLLAVLPLVLLGVGMMAMTGCGSGGSSTSTATTTPVGTSKGAYTVTITATPAAGTAVTGTVTLTVQ